MRCLMKDRLRSLSALLALGLPATALGDQAELNRFFDSKYTYCDAKMLSGLWNSSLEDSKARIGRKIGWKNLDVINDMLKEARGVAEKNPNNRCSFHEAGFTYQDAEKLSKVWHKSIGESKTMV